MVRYLRCFVCKSGKIFNIHKQILVLNKLYVSDSITILETKKHTHWKFIPLCRFNYKFLKDSRSAQKHVINRVCILFKLIILRKNVNQLCSDIIVVLKTIWNLGSVCYNSKKRDWLILRQHNSINQHPLNLGLFNNSTWHLYRVTLRQRMSVNRQSLSPGLVKNNV